ncbi:hypothetical protein DdX_00107 [Ditylenchus destructor]|uniref:Uncharacterized protein n=1 Tax=Ditylenchus destructor TaxID=166010 RepID=A0AAD4NJC6_9BILA|nr:hypothetical protein DdX_00107 [Ditylenchus destructor]
MEAFQTILQINRNQRVDPEEIEFLEALTKLGDGELQERNEGEFEFSEECMRYKTFTIFLFYLLRMMQMRAAHFLDLLTLSDITILRWSQGSSTICSDGSVLYVLKLHLCVHVYCCFVLFFCIYSSE